MTLTHLGYPVYLDEADNRAISLVRLREDNMLCLSKLMRRTDCIRCTTEDVARLPIALEAAESYLEFEDHICSGTYYHLHLPLHRDLVTIANRDISNVSIDGMVIDPELEEKVWLLPELRLQIEEQCSNSLGISAEKYVLRYGHPLDMGYLRVEKENAFTRSYVDKGDWVTVMVLTQRCGYAKSTERRDMGMAVVQKQMAEKRADIERVLPQLTPKVLSHAMLIDTEEQIAGILRTLGGGAFI